MPARTRRAVGPNSHLCVGAGCPVRYSPAAGGALHGPLVASRAVTELHSDPKRGSFLCRGRYAGNSMTDPLTPATGVSRINVRDVPHGAFEVTGDNTFKLLAVHMV